ncbi:MAG: helix-turn-helix domain-containing protein, partial [Myxococcota bacterium]
RLIAATHQNLDAMVTEGRFRQDLYFRFAVTRIDIPALRARGDDILQIADHYLEQLAERTQSPPKRLTAAAKQALLAYQWPGNVRQLHNVLQHAHVSSLGEEIDLSALPLQGPNGHVASGDVASPAPLSFAPGLNPETDTLPAMSLDELERWAIVSALKRNRGNASEAINELKIGRATFYRRLREYGIRR